MSGMESDERQAYADMLERFCVREIEPAVAGIEASNEFPRDLYTRFADLGVLSLYLPSEDDSSSAQFRMTLLALERLARVNIGFAVSVSNVGDCLKPIMDGASPSLKERWVASIVSGAAIPAFCLSEASGGSDVAAMRCRAEAVSGGYRISGSKSWITNAPVADLFIVFARSESGERPHDELSCFLVDRQAEGLSVMRTDEMLGLRGCSTAEVVLDQVHVNENALIGRPGQGFQIAMSTLDESRLSIAAIALGAAAQAADISVTYAREREQFGKKLIQHQGMMFKLASLATDLAAARSLVEDAVRAFADSEPRQAGLYAAMAKLYSSDVAMRTAIEAVQTLGAVGLTKAHAAERILRDCKALQIFEGTNEIQTWLIGRDLAAHGLRLRDFNP